MRSEYRVYYKDGGVEGYPVTFSNTGYVQKVLAENANAIKVTLFTSCSENDFTETTMFSK